MTIDYRHLERMTDEGGMLQFSRLGAPDRDSGYTVDDNARALLVALNMQGEKRRKLAGAYIRFLDIAQGADGWWRNWKLNGRFVTTIDSDDSQGRAFLSCCAASLCELEDVREFSNHLIGLYDKSRRRNWHWFEDDLTYCNGILPHALFAYYSFSQDRKALRVARDTLGFLTDALFARGYLNIVGNQGWWHRGAEIPCYDQQPVDACSTALACAQAFRATGDSQYQSLAELAYDWYQGNNINRIGLYDATTGGCYDALIPDGVNHNQGAESLLSLLLSQQMIGRMTLTGQDTEIIDRTQEATEA